MLHRSRQTRITGVGQAHPRGSGSPERAHNGHAGSRWKLGAPAAVALVLAAAGLATAGCGSTTTTISNAAATGPRTVSVAVTSPTGGSVIAADSVVVRGTVDPASATVQVQGRPAVVGNGVFTVTADLHGGKTTIDVIGSAPGATPGSTAVVVSRQSGEGSPRAAASSSSAQSVSQATPEFKSCANPDPSAAC